MWGIKLVVLIEGDQYLPLLVITSKPIRRFGSSLVWNKALKPL